MHVLILLQGDLLMSYHRFTTQSPRMCRRDAECNTSYIHPEGLARKFRDPTEQQCAARFCFRVTFTVQSAFCYTDGVYYMQMYVHSPCCITGYTLTPGHHPPGQSSCRACLLRLTMCTWVVCCTAVGMTRSVHFVALDHAVRQNMLGPCHDGLLVVRGKHL